MKVYKLQANLRGPDQDSEKPYLAEVPTLPGCRAWGDTAAEALENLQSVATAFVQSYQERGRPLATRGGERAGGRGYAGPQRRVCSGVNYRDLTQKLRRLGCEMDC